MSHLPHTHPDRDDTLIARLAADDLPPGDRDAVLARSRIADCPACAELFADLVAIVAATAELPAPARTRDFRLTDADAARLRPAGWRGALVRLRSPGFAFTRPLATGLATLGIAGLLLSALPTGFLGASAGSERVLSAVGNSAAGAPDDGSSTGSGAYGPLYNASAAPAPAQPSVAAGNSQPVQVTTPSSMPSPAPTASPGLGAGGGTTTTDSGKNGGAPGASAVASPAQDAGRPPTEAAHDVALETGGPSALVVLSLVLLGAGLILGGLRLAARRLA